MLRPRKSVSQNQLAANRANAARSTGPRTPQGKARSAQNALKHGFAASTFAVVRLEDLQEIAHLRAGLIAVYRPVNAQELFAIERIALAQQVILRVARLETGLFTTCLNEALDPSGTVQSNRWALAKRYRAQAERHYRRAVEEFDRLKALRPELVKFENEAILESQPNQSKSLNRFTGGFASAHEPISTPVGQTPPPEHPVGQAVPPVRHQLLSDRCIRREEPVRTPR